MTKPKTTDKKPTTQRLTFFAGKWLIGCEHTLIVTHETSKSVTLEYAGVSLGKHFGELHEYKPS